MGVERAILLVAGGGRRLGARAGGSPKCLVEVAGVSILERAIRSLARAGVEEAVLVTGYESSQVRAFAGDRLGGIRVRYVENPDYGITNTAHSLWLARGHLSAGCLLIEGDILFDSAAILRLLAAASGRGSAWAAIGVAAARDEGVLLCTGDEGHIREVGLFPEPGRRPERFRHKCAGIQLLSERMAGTLASELDRTVANGDRRIFADLVLARLIDLEPVVLCPLDDLRWAEVDTPADLSRAERIFRRGPTTRVTPEPASAGEGA